MLYFWPNRPFLLQPTDPTVARLSADPNWSAELKFNGDRLCLQKHSDPTPWKQFDGFVFANRHKDYLKRFEPSKTLLDELKSLNLPDGTQLDGELLHFHTKAIKFKIVFYDIYVLGGKQITEPLYARRNILTDIFAGRKFNHLSISEQHASDFSNLFNEVIKREEIEGLVMKDARGKITFNTTASNDVTWQFKCRKSSKNYAF